MNFEFFVLNHSYGYLECISWIPGFNGKTQRNKNDFFWRCHVWKITIFPQPRGGQKRHFFAQFFFFRISIVITSRCIWGGLFEFSENVWWKNDKFSSTMTYYGILEFKLFEFWIFWFKSLLWLFGSVFHGSQGSLAKSEEIRMIFFLRCHVWKITIFSQPRGGQKRHYFAQFFFLWISILITGRCIWGGLFEFFENLCGKNDKFSSTMTY